MQEEQTKVRGCFGEWRKYMSYYNGNYNGEMMVMTDDSEKELLKTVRKGGTIASILMAVIGALAVFAPTFTGLTVAYLITGGFAIYGVFKIAAYFGTPKFLRSGFMLADGILSAFLGGLILIDAIAGPEGRASMIATLAFAAGFMALFNGITQTADYFELRKEGFSGAGFILFGGILRIVMGMLIIVDPFFGWFSLQLGLGTLLMISAIALFIETRSLKIGDLEG